MRSIASILIAAGCAFAGCAVAPDALADEPPRKSGSRKSAPDGEGPVAYVDSQSVAWADVRQALIEAAGGQIMLEEVLDRGIDRRLRERNLKLTEAQVKAEASLLAEGLDPNADQAQRLLTELRNRRGLGDVRYQKLLRRNAGLRALVQDEVETSDAALRTAYENIYGPRYEARLVLVDALPDANEVFRRAKAGESFTDLAVRSSTDSSRVQGGLLPPISLADATFPAAVRDALRDLREGDVSNPVALDRGFAVLKLERKIEGQAVKFDDVREQLAKLVRRDVEGMLMQRLARTIAGESDVVVLDSALQKSWAQQKRRLTAGANP